MTEVNQQQAAQLQARLIARAWRDPAFKAKLLADPHAALKDAGLAVRDGVTVRVLENTDRQVHLVLPPRPGGEMSEADLNAVAGGGDLQGKVRDAVFFAFRKPVV